MLRALLLFLLVLFIARAVWRLLGGVLQGAATIRDAAGNPVGKPHRPASAPPVKMIQDPICGTYVVPGKALELTRGRETIYFCSDKFRDEWGRRAD